jgi:hypothetical protein
MIRLTELREAYDLASTCDDNCRECDHRGCDKLDALLNANDERTYPTIAALLEVAEAAEALLPLCGMDAEAEYCDDGCDVCTIPPLVAALAWLVKED